MSEAPERIWAWPWNGEARRGQWNTSQINDGVEYIRADLPRPKVKPLEWVDLWCDGIRYDVTSDHPCGYTDSILGFKDGTYQSRFGSFDSLEEAKAAALDGDEG